MPHSEKHLQSSLCAVMSQSQVARAPHPVLAVDGISLERWLHGALPESWLLGLVPAQGWLIDDEEFRWAWQRISSVEPGTSTIVPVLVCGDDVDLSCSVVVVEQEALDEKIIWRRFGHSRSGGKEAGITTQWFSNLPALDFKRQEFESALNTFRTLANSEWK